MLYRLIFFILFISFPVYADFNSEDITDLYKKSSIKKFKLNPSGNFAAAIYVEGKANYIDIYNLETRKGKNILITP